MQICFSVSPPSVFIRVYSTPYMGAYSRGCWKIDEREFVWIPLILLWFFFSKIDIFFLVSSCYSTRIGARALFPYCKPTWFWYSFTSYICPCYALTTQGLVFTIAHVAIIIPPVNMNLTKQNKNLPHFSSDVWYRTSLHRLRCDIHTSPLGGKFHSKSNMRVVHQQS